MSQFSSPQPDNAPPPPGYQPPKQSNGCLYVALGCGGLVLLGVVLLAIGGFYIARNAKNIAADMSVVVADSALKEGGMPPAQREQVVARVRRIADEFKEGNLTMKDLEKFGQKIGEDKAIIAAGILYFVDSHLLNNEKLDPAQREQAGRALQRVTRGVVEDKIDLKSLRDLVDKFLDPPGPDGDRNLKKNLTKEEVDEIIAEATELADGVEIPDEPYEIDVVEHIDNIIEEVIGTE